MPVVINEFEVVAEPASRPAPSAPAATQPAQEPPDLERLLSTKRERDARVRAY
jgi:hypothetical protein